jgi:hypothetical protein
LPVLIERYSTNRKIRYLYTHYVCSSAQLKKGLRLGDVDVTTVTEVITDGRQVKSVVLESTSPDLKDTVSFWRPDRRYCVVRSQAGFTLMGDVPAFAKHYSHETPKYDSFAFEPMRAGGSTIGTSLWLDDLGRSPPVAIKVVGAKQSKWKGKNTIEVRSRWSNWNSSEFVSTHLDPTNDLVSLGAETDWITEPVKGSDPPRVERYKLIDEIEYRKSEEGFPLPKSSRQSSLYEDGSTRKIYEVEFLSYERYTPSMEEFRLEGQYGLETPRDLAFTGWNPPVVPAPKPDSQSKEDPSLESDAPIPRLEPPPARRWLILAALAILAGATILWIRSMTRSQDHRGWADED